MEQCRHIVFRIFQDKLQLVLFRTSEMTEFLKSDWPSVKSLEIDLVFKRLLVVFLNTSNLNTQSDHT